MLRTYLFAPLLVLLLTAEVVAANVSFFTVGEVWRSFTLLAAAALNAAGALA